MALGDVGEVAQMTARDGAFSFRTTRHVIEGGVGQSLNSRLSRRLLPSQHQRRRARGVERFQRRTV